MKVLFDGSASVHYGFIYLKPASFDVEIDLIQARGGQRNGLCGAAYPGVLAMLTGLHTGDVPLRVESHLAEPVPEPRWEDVVETPLAIGAEQYHLDTFDWGVELESPPAGTYRARWSASGMDEAHAGGTRRQDEPEIDRYLLQLWPAPLAPDVVVRQGSDQAAYWHGVAATAVPPPAPPTTEQVADHEAEEALRQRAARAEWEAAQQLMMWGVRAPSDELRAVGGRTAQLAALDREIADVLVALPPARQRTLAVWAARRACEVAGIADLDWVQSALGAASRSEPLPDLWADWGSVWERLFPSEELEWQTSIVVDEPTGHRPIAPEATAIDAVREAGGGSPAQAVMGAVDALVRGHADPSVVIDELKRGLIAGGPPGGS